MNCHECARVGRVRPALGLCKHCLVGLCKDHLVSSSADRRELLVSCRHAAEQAWEERIGRP